MRREAPPARPALLAVHYTCSVEFISQVVTQSVVETLRQVRAGAGGIDMTGLVKDVVAHFIRGG